MRGIAAFVAMTTLLWAAAPPVRAAGEPSPLSLPALIRELRQANPDLLAARKRLEAMQARVPMAKGLPAPRIGVEWEEIPRGTVKLNKATMMLQLIQALPFPGKLSLRHQVALKDAQLAAVAFKQTEWEKLTMLKGVYYDLFLADREEETQRERLLWLEQATASARARYATGQLRQAGLLSVQAELLEASNELVVLSHRRQAMEAHLNHLLNRDSAAAVGHPQEPALAPVPETPEALLAEAEERQPELLAMKLSVERAEAQLKLAKRELLPDLETMLELRDPPMAPIGPWDLTLALVLPFWFWTKQKYGVKVALHDKESMEAAYQAMHNEIARRIHESWHEAQGAYETARLCREGLVPYARQAVASALAGYEAGQASFMELTQSLDSLAQRRRTYYEHLVMLEQQLIHLEQAVGIALRPDHEQEAYSTGEL